MEERILDDTRKYIYHACIKCGKYRWVKLIRGNPRNVYCHKCAIAKPWDAKCRINHEKAIKEMQFKRDTENDFGTPYIGEIRKGRFIGRNKGTRASTNYIWLKCLSCNVERWVEIKNGKPHNQRCRSCARKQVWSIPEKRDNYKRTIKEAQSTPEMREKRRLLANEEFKNPDVISKLSESLTKAFAKPEYKTKIRNKYSQPEEIIKRSNATKKNWEDEQYRNKQIARFKNQWADPKWHDKQVGLALQGNNIKPNKPETSINNILNELYPNQWKYTGDGSVIIGGLNPDFTNINGKKEVIELFGDWWHSDKKIQNRWKSSEIGRIEVFKKYGFSCLVIWERELKDKQKVVDKIKQWVTTVKNPSGD
jgi:hypothetical protein